MIETNETPDLASNGAGDSGASVQVARGSEQPQSGDPLLARMDDATTAPATTIITTSTTTTTATSSQASTLADTQGSSISSARTASTRSAASSKCSSAVIGGNLTTSSGSSLGSIKLAVERAPLDAGPALVAVRTSEIEPPAAASSDSLTLSSNEEFQSARIDLNEDFDDDDDDDVEDSHIMTNDETGNGRRRSDKRPNDKNVTKIEIGRNIEALQKSRSAQSSPLVTTTMRLQQQQQQSAFQKQQRKQESHQNSPMTPHVLRSPHMLRSQTSPSPLNHLAGKLPPVMRAGGKLGSLNTGDSASQFSLQYKYQGSNHFEIRWQNVCLYARPSSRLPSFITDNSVYRTLFGDDSLSSSDPNETGNGMGLFNNGPRQPPYSPPLKHHQIPPTIDENLEMKCPNAEFEAATNQRPIMAIADSSTSSNSSSSSIETTKQTQSQTPPPRAMTTTPVPPTPSPQPPSTAQSPGVRCVLNNISGQVFSGQMTAILGPSGVGKTSLLNSLTGRNTMDGTGRVSLIGANNSKRMSVVTVPQLDVLPSKLTTNEDLQFTSRLKNPQAKFDHQRNIDRLVKHLHMDKFLHTKIDKLSGGEARRLSIARELLNSPDIMILDEPTSGLDANTCKKIITALRDIVEHSDNILDKPMSIIITIHQPQQEVYQLFHRVYVMAVGGRVVYEGSPQLLMPTVLEYSSIGRIVPVEQLNENPAIVAIEVASGEYGSQVIEELAVHHEGQVYEEFTCFNGNGGGGSLGGLESPMLTPRSLRMHKSPSSISRFDVQLHRKRLESAGDGSIGRPTPILAKRHLGSSQWDRMSAVTSVSYASTYDAELPEQTSKLKVDKRLRRSVVMKSHFVSHTITLIKRCWLLTMRDMFLMSIRILGFLLVAGGTVQIFSGALDPNEHQCPQFETDVDDIPSYLGQVQTRLVGLFEMLRQGNSTHLLFFHLLLCITMVTSALTGLVFPLQMRMFIREYKNGWYSPASFIMSQTIAELPADIVGPLLTLLITYPLCHQPDSIYHWRLAGYSVVVILASIICKSQAQIVGAFLMDSVENSVFISCVAVTPPALLSGVPLRIEQMILPLRLISYGSFLRYAFESLLELRYGFDMCPCDKSIIHGPLKVSLSAVPPHLESLATGLLELSLPPNSTTAAPLDELDKALSLSSNPATIGEGEHDNVFLKFLRLVTDASNMFTSNSEINDCDRYRSLYLINMGVKNNTLVSWLAVMVLMFIISRILTYFAVKTVIKLRRS